MITVAEINANRWWPITRRPAAFRTLICLTEREEEFSGLAYVPTRAGSSSRSPTASPSP